MRNRIFNNLVLATLVSAGFGLATVAHATAPTVTITAPTGTQYVQGFPVNIGVTLSIDHRNDNGNCQTNAVKDIVVTAQLQGDITPVPIHTSSEDPINNDPQVCPVAYSFNWTVRQAGTYDLVVTLAHGGAEGEAEETVIFDVLAVEYPAPPAVANAYMNSLAEYKKDFTGKVRGCIISMIAENHAKFRAYDLTESKGGPYDVDMIQYDVRDFSKNYCGGPTIPDPAE